jgi:hypothetical protein
MTEFFFSQSNCPVSNKVEKIDFDFIASCEIAETPPPILDCDLPIIAREQEIPCPEFNATSNIIVGYGPKPVTLDDGRFCDLDFPSRIDFKIQRAVDASCPTDDVCRFDADIDINVILPPPPCPIIDIDKFSVDTFFEDKQCLKKSKFNIIKTERPGKNCNDPGTCEFLLELEIAVPLPRPPCPKIKVKKFRVETSYNDECPRGPSRFVVTPKIRPPRNCRDTGACDFDIELEINIPIPRPPCPEINVTKFAVESGYTSFDDSCRKQNRFAITRKYAPQPCVNPAQKDKCDFDVELEIFIPIPAPLCPELKISNFKVYTGFAGRPCVADKRNKFQITTKKRPGINCNDPGSCEFLFDLEIVVPIPPIPCPKIAVKKFNVDTFYSDECSRPTSRFVVITKKREPRGCNGISTCDFDIELEVNIPIPRPPCPEINVTKFVVNSSYDTGEELCKKPNRFEITRKYTPQTCSNPNAPDKCDFDVELEIHVDLPPPPCPEVKINTFKVHTGFSDRACVIGKQNRFTVTTNKRPATCNDPGACEFSFDLEIVVPIPPPPCPDITVKTFDISTIYSDECAKKPSRFTVTKKRKPPRGCTGIEECDFEIDLTLVVPVPRPPCPEINVKKFIVGSSYVLDDGSCEKPNRFEITRRREKQPCKNPTLQDKCDFDVELEIFIPIPRPPCPEINVNTFEVVTFYEGREIETPPNNPICPRDSTFVVTRKSKTGNCESPDECDFEIDLTIAVPIPVPPCPTFKPKLTVTTGYNDCRTKPDTFEFVPKITRGVGCSEPDNCEFDVNLEIFIPIPRIPCPRFNVKSFSVKSFYNTDECREEGECEGSCITITPRPDPPLDCENPREPNCEFDLELAIKVPIPPPPPCPEIRVRNFDVVYVDNVIPSNSPDEVTDALKALYPQFLPVNRPDGDPLPSLSTCNYFAVTRSSSSVPGKCGETKNCDFDIDLKLCIPTPPCPTININSFEIKVAYQDCLGDEESEFTCKRKETEQCEFDLDLSIVVPLPRPSCPIFGTNLGLQTFFMNDQNCLPGRPVFGCGAIPIGQGASWFTVEPVTSKCCDQDGGVENCGFQFDLNIAVPLPKLVQEILVEPKPVKFELFWCKLPAANPPPGPQPAPRQNIIAWTFDQEPDPWEFCCDKGIKAEFKPELKIEYQIPRMPCEFIELRPQGGVVNAATDFKVKLVDSAGNITDAPAGTKFELTVVPKPPNDDCAPCAWEFFPELIIPKGCDKITYEPDTGSEIVYFLAKDIQEAQEQSKVEITLTQDETDKCKYSVKHYLNIGWPRPTCDGEVTVKNSEGAELGSGTISCTTEDGKTKQKIDIILDTVACPPVTSEFRMAPADSAPIAPITAKPATKTMRVITDVKLVDGQLDITYETVTVLVD